MLHTRLFPSFLQQLCGIGKEGTINICILLIRKKRYKEIERQAQVTELANSKARIHTGSKLEQPGCRVCALNHRTLLIQFLYVMKCNIVYPLSIAATQN